MRIAAVSGTTRAGASYLLRSPEPDEAEVMLDFLRQQARESYRNLVWGPEHFERMTADEEARILAGFLEHPTNFLLAAYVDGRLAGNLGLNADPFPCASHSGQLGMGLLEEFHGQGLGKALLALALEEAERAGLWNVRLRVRTFNEPAIRLYESQGFERVGTLRAIAHIDGAYCDEYLYQRVARPV